ncbi:hypothetical protein TRVL_06657 [Trypanosoma vivax]|nr:hypothetical protein TRVL_06657 [Trypanosoma vivax]
MLTCKRRLFSATTARLASPSETMLRTTFWSTCAEVGVGFQDGLPEDLLASAVSGAGRITIEDARALLRTSRLFSIDAGHVRMIATELYERNQIEAMLLKVAAKLPVMGVSGSQLQGILEDEAPHFQPSAVGALSLRDAIQCFPKIFTVDVDSTGRWTVRCTTKVNESAPTRVGDPSNIVSFCRRRMLMGRQEEYVPLRVAMKEENITDRDLLRKLISNKEISKLLQIKFEVSVRPKRPERNAICFIDADEIGVDAVEAMWKGMCLSSQSTRFVARRPTSRGHSSNDIITPDNMPAYSVLELKARELAMGSSVILQDIVYMCSLKQFSLYAEHIAALNTFPDADVYVCCPSKLKLVAGRQFAAI